jgi:hypothetical protein
MMMMMISQERSSHKRWALLLLELEHWSAIVSHHPHHHWTQVWASKVLWDGLIHGSKSSQRNVVIMSRIIKQLAAEELTPALQHDQLQFWSPAKLHLKTSLQQPTTYLSLEAASKWWWVWALCAMQACGMKKEERREPRQDTKSNQGWCDNCVFDHHCNSAQCTNQLYMKYAPSTNPPLLCLCTDKDHRINVEHMQISVYHQNWWKN